ncbi:GH92 family glycosyl hydrolase, partial [Kibdelosporangium lantanae]
MTTVAPSRTRDRLPRGPLFGLFLSGFVGILTECLPAGLLPEISGTLHTDVALTGQIVTIYALATALAAIPLSRLTASWSRKNVLQVALTVVTVTNVTGGTDTQLRTLYTALYHSLLHPNVFSDVDGKYTGFDNQVHQTVSGHTQYANFSGWDVYRSQVALVALVAPAEASDIAQSAINQNVYSGYFDRWTLANGGTGVMNGDPLTAIISTMYAFGATNFDAADGLRRSVAGVNDIRERPGWLQYNQYGYVPTGLGDVWGSASTTLEYTSADFAISQLAARLGDTANAENFLRRAQNWRSLFESGNKYLQPRNTDTTFPGFSPTQTNEYVEGNAGQYTWMVPYNYRGLFDAMGGNASVLSRLDSFFVELNAGPDKNEAYLGNEPTLETPWSYAYAGAPYKTQDIVRRALTTIFKPIPEGEVGNDDLGEMSSWAVWAALGMYPEAPGRA